MLDSMTAEVKDLKPPPLPYVVHRSCPDPECCAFGVWQARKSAMLFAQPTIASERIAAVAQGQSVEALEGQMIVESAGEIILRANRTIPNSRDKIPLGETVYSLVPMGHEFVRVWYQGYEFDLETDGLFSPRDCQDAGVACLAEIKNLPRWRWWVQIRTQDGTLGWTDQPNFFAGKDMCTSGVVTQPAPPIQKSGK